VDSLSVAVAAIPSNRADVVAGSDVAIIFVNGRDLLELANAASVSRRPGSAVTAFSPDRYAPLQASAVLASSLHLLGSPSPRLSKGGRAVVLCCGCGAWECGGLLALVEVDDGVVTWSDFQTPYSLDYIAEHPGQDLPIDLSLEGLGPFRFARAEYEAALRRPERIAWPYVLPHEEPPYEVEPSA
jgi:hypothetical protein